MRRILMVLLAVPLLAAFSTDETQQHAPKTRGGDILPKCIDCTPQHQPGGALGHDFTVEKLCLKPAQCVAGNNRALAAAARKRCDIINDVSPTYCNGTCPRTNPQGKCRGVINPTSSWNQDMAVTAVNNTGVACGAAPAPGVPGNIECDVTVNIKANKRLSCSCECVPEE
jgi:hypothetical protein